MLGRAMEAEEEGHWGDFNSYLAVFEWVVIILIVMTLTFDTAQEALTDWLREKAGVGEQANIKLTNLHHMYHRLLNRYKSEMMVLGYLAFVVWICNVGGFFNSMVTWGHSNEGESGEGEGEDRRLAEFLGTADTFGLICRRLSEENIAEEGESEGEEVSSKTAGAFYWGGGTCRSVNSLSFPTVGEDLLETVESAHMCLFL